MLNSYSFRFLLIIHLALLSQVSFAQTMPERLFANPPADARPWTFWHWVRGGVSKAGIKADIVAMKEIGLEGAMLFAIRGSEDSYYEQPVEQLTPEWWEMLRYAMHVSDSVGLKMGMHISDGFALAGGPWIRPEESMQKVVFSDTIVKGGRITNLKLRQPETIEGFYRDIDAYAIPLKKHKETFAKTIKATTETGETLIAPTADTWNLRADESAIVDFEYARTFTLKNIEITPSGNNIQTQRFRVLGSTDGVRYKEIRQLAPPRQGWQNTGFNTTFALQPTKVRFVRLQWSPQGTEPGSEELDAAKWRPTLRLKNIQLSAQARIDNWEGKSGIVWRIANAETSQLIGKKDFVPVSKIIRLKAHMNNGVLNYRLPAGQWQILRIGHTSTGHTNATGGAGKGLECDKFSEAAVQKQFDNWIGAAFEKTDAALARRVLKMILVDSWECGSQNWSNNFATQFQQKYGYDLMPYLPLLAGIPIDNAQKSEQVLRDVRHCISELVSEVFFKVMKQNAVKYDCLFAAESVAPTFVSDGMQHFKQVDRPMGEFWLRSPTHDKPNDMLDAISGARIYGKNIVQAEGFTQLRTNWDEHPAMLKPMLDRNFALGLNKLFFHVYVHNPYTHKAPGATLDGIGLYFQRDQTWWKQGKAFVDYIARCQALLQYGQPVVDVAVYSGDEMPRRALTPEKLVDILPGIVGHERVERERNRRANAGQPMAEMPAGVRHAANIFAIEQWVNPLNGYAYDSFNPDVLQHHATAKNGSMQLDGGANYKIVVVPQNTHISAASQQKLDALKTAGVQVITEPHLAADFSGLGIKPDCLVPPHIAWTHRRGPEADIYFVANQLDSRRTFEASFRISHGQVQLWNPVDGSISAPEQCRYHEGRVHLTLTLEANASVFVVFLSNAKHQPSPTLQGKTEALNLQWDIHFVANNIQLKNSTLFDWSTHSNDSIKYYSGTAIYKSKFQYQKGNSTTKLNLGQVHNMATVRINGQNCGTVWTAPYILDISHALHTGENHIEIELVNTWANAINGHDKNKAPFANIWTNGKYRLKDDILLPAGLLGPLELHLSLALENIQHLSLAIGNLPRFYIGEERERALIKY